MYLVLASVYREFRAVLFAPPVEGINELTKKELIAECIQRGLRKYGQLNKPELVRLLEGVCASG